MLRHQQEISYLCHLFLGISLWSGGVSVAHAIEVWSIPEMNCAGCETKVAEIVDGFSDVKLRGSSAVLREICLDGNIQRASLQKALKEKGYSLASVRQAERCPRIPKMWADVQGDFKVVSTKARFSMKKERVADKFTLFDFGAAWCAPCHVNAQKLKVLLQERNDLAIRAIDLEGDVEEAFYHPVANQYLSKASRLPWLVLYCKNGKKCYEGSDLNEALKYLE